jgi:sugar phosphate isomerase/epimerase
MHWKGGVDWEVSQHLKNIEPYEVINIISKSGLELISIHDCGGVIEPGVPSAINHQIHKYLNVYKQKDLFLVFHVPHTQKCQDDNWWAEYINIFEQDLACFDPKTVCIENLPRFNGYFVPLLTPEEMFAFLCKNGFYSNIDITHYAEIDVDVYEAINILRKKVKTVHLSNFIKGNSHLSTRKGQLDISKIISSFDQTITEAVTLEINIPKEIKQNKTEIINFLRIEKEYLENLLNTIKNYTVYRNIT